MEGVETSSGRAVSRPSMVLRRIIQFLLLVKISLMDRGGPAALLIDIVHVGFLPPPLAAGLRDPPDGELAQEELSAVGARRPIENAGAGEEFRRGSKNVPTRHSHLPYS